MDVVTLQAAKAAAIFRPKLWYPDHLRRWRVALSDALWGVKNVVVIGDSITVGQDVTGTTDSSAASENQWRAQGWPAQLRSLLAQTYGDAGEGLTWTSPEEPRVQRGGSPTPTTDGAFGPFAGATGARLLQSGNFLTLDTTADAYPAAFTDCDIVCFATASTTAAETITYSVDGATPVAYGVHTVGSAFAFRIPITGMTDAAHTITVNGPTSGDVRVVGFVTKRSNVNGGGVRVHRIAHSGATTDEATKSTLGVSSADTPNLLTSYTTAIAATIDLAVIAFGANDATTASQTAGITTSIFTANLDKIAQKVITAGGSVLLCAGPQRAVGDCSPHTEADFYAAARAYAGATDHVAFFDLSELWGTSPGAGVAAGDALGLQNYSVIGVHPTRAGHGDYARAVHAALTGHRGITHG